MVNRPDWRVLSPGDQVAWFIGSGFGMGFVPVAPGTFGSALALGLPLYAQMAWPGARGALALALAAAVGFVIGVWATGRMATAENPDPGTAVWDEFVGTWITFLPVVGIGNNALVNFVWLWNWSGYLWPVFAAVMLTGLLAFRAMDVAKPWPCRRLERLPGGWGIMLDDVAAGLWSALLLLAVWLMWLGLRVALGLFGPEAGGCRSAFAECV